MSLIKLQYESKCISQGMDPEGMTSHLLEHQGEEGHCLRKLGTCDEKVCKVKDDMSPHVIFIGVPITSQETLTQTSSENFISAEFDNVEIVQRQHEKQKNQFQIWSLACGLLVGGFIQLSSLGANYMLLELYEGSLDAGTVTTDSIGSIDVKDTEDVAIERYLQNNMAASSIRTHVLTFSLIWSVVTSLMGVVVLLLLKALILLQTKSSASSNHQRSSSNKVAMSLPVLLTHLECTFAVGTLLGLCIVCIITDLLLGCGAHLAQSFSTLIAAMVWSKLLLLCAGLARDDIIEVENTELSLNEEPIANLSASAFRSLSGNKIDEESNSLPICFCFTSFALGFIVGLFTQLSSMGANFLLMQWRVPRDNHSAILCVSLVWALITSLMGIFVMILVRGLVVLSSSLTSTTNPPKEAKTPLVTIVKCIVFYLECSFAIGALMGVNVAWMATDLFLGLHLHLTHSLVSLVVALLWCQTVVWCIRCHR